MLYSGPDSIGEFTRTVDFAASSLIKAPVAPAIQGVKRSPKGSDRFLHR